MSRFYIEGIEIDVSDPTFYLSVEHAEQHIETLTEYKNDNMDSL